MAPRTSCSIASAGQRRGAALFVLRRTAQAPRCVSSGQPTHTEEFYEITDASRPWLPSESSFGAWEHTYNFVRPHQALGYLTPAEYLVSVGIKV